MRRGVILFGPPASGKDTVTGMLQALNRQYVHYQRLKAGGGRTSGYRIATHNQLDRLEERGELIYRNEQYGATYAVDRPGLAEAAAGDRVPILHIGQTRGVAAITERYPLRWFVAALWCTKEVAGQRIHGRGDTRLAERLAVWDATLADMRSADPGLFTLTINTSEISAQQSAVIIDSCCVWNRAAK